MKKEVDIDKYNELCDRIRSVILYTGAFRKKNEKRRMAVQELLELVRKNGVELFEKIESLEELTNDLCEIKREK